MVMENDIINMKVLILGGDGFCGWPTTLHLADLGYEVAIIDNQSRRSIDIELGSNSLTPICSIEERIDAWYEITGKRIEYHNINLAEDYESLKQVLTSFRPDTIIHFAEQRAAPYSMKSPKHKRYTISNNTNCTHNVLCAIVELNMPTHLVHLGTMGVYGYGTAGISLPEGYINTTLHDSNGNVGHVDQLYPTNPGSIYHLTKCLDQELFKYYAKNDQVRITDLHQGIVWGTHTAQTKLDERLINRFDYDGDYGTVLNRFLLQAAIGYPLTVHGSGGQTRAFININDSMKCIHLAMQNPPKPGEKVKIFNQFTETHSILELAKLISDKFTVEIQHIDNPRNEADTNLLNASNCKFTDLGLEPIKLQDQLFDEIAMTAKKYQSRINQQLIPCTSSWNNSIKQKLDATEHAE